MTVFVLDNDEIRIETFLKAIDQSHHITVCRSVTEAMQRYPYNRPYDILLLTYNLLAPSTLNGEDFARAIPALAAVNGEFIDKSRVFIVDKLRDGTSNMMKLLHEKGFEVSWIPYGIALVNYLERVSAGKGETTVVG